MMKKDVLRRLLYVFSTCNVNFQDFTLKELKIKLPPNILIDFEKLQKELYCLYGTTYFVCFCQYWGFVYPDLSNLHCTIRFKFLFSSDRYWHW